LKLALEGEDLEEIKEKSAEVSTASQKIGESVYKNKEGSEESSASAADEKEDVMDADFKEK